MALPSRLNSAPAVLNILPYRVHIDHLLFGIEIDQVDLFKQECDLMLSTMVYCILKKISIWYFAIIIYKMQLLRMVSFINEIFISICK